MPELPEVETVRRGLEPTLAGGRFARVECRRPDLRFPLPERFAERLTGETVLTLGRRAKYLIARLSGGDVLVMHLGMSGRFTIAKKAGTRTRPGEFTHDNGADPAHDHVVLHMAGGATVIYNDPRRFGFMLLVPAAELDAHPMFRDLGPEPLGNELSAAGLAARAAGRKADLKAFLMDQRTVAGLGNIYVCEALHQAGLSPRRAAGALARRGGQPNERTERLVGSIRRVLEQAIAAGGSTLRDYRAADGALGYFQHAFRVYGREGEACQAAGCTGRIRRIVQAGRSTFYCPSCQR
jgi:formamidopyrimidine-DNA glycosylase